MTVYSADRTISKRGISKIVCDTCVTEIVIGFHRPCREYKRKEVI